MCDPVSAVIGGAALLGAGTSIYSGNKAAKAQKKAQASAEASSAREAQRAEQAANRANQRQPDIAAMFGANQQRAGSGVGSTFLTGPGGANAGIPTLGGVSLLGQ